MEYLKYSSVHLSPGSVWISLCFNTPNASFYSSDKKRGLNVILEWLTSISFPTEKRLFFSIQTVEKNAKRKRLFIHSLILSLFPSHYSPLFVQYRLCVVANSQASLIPPFSFIHSLLSFIRKLHIVSTSCYCGSSSTSHPRLQHEVFCQSSLWMFVGNPTWPSSTHFVLIWLFRVDTVLWPLMEPN